ncbi:uncharacterized protein LOC100374809, partial [Saccoglossus kowalevskii]|uniref:CDK5 regulatory subunit-associated protein 2-like n=1 Tax=Saccoglossus kowalevskii TaxID=10224 RepID=A0ABM0N1G9_SACKO
MMASDRTLRCPDCGMSFNTINMMTKHRDKFCVGRTTTRMTLASDDYSDSDEETQRSMHPAGYEQVSELQKMKLWQRQQRNLMDTKEKIFLEDLKAKERAEQRKAASVKKILHRNSPMNKSPSKDLWELNAEYDDVKGREEKLRTQLRDVTDIIARSPIRQGAISRLSDMTLPYMSDDDDDVSPRWKREHQAHLRSLAEQHGVQLRDLQDRNMDLERQKEEIRRRLEELGRQELKSSDSTMERMIGALKDQERRNQKTLEELKRQLIAMQHKPPSRKKIISIPYHTGSLVSEISAMRLAYLQSGGNDPVILAQMHDMQAEAQMLEDMSKKKPPKKKPKDNGFDQQQWMLEMENQRLQEELLYLQNKRKRQQDMDYAELPSPVTLHTITPLPVTPPPAISDDSPSPISSSRELQ